MSQTEYNWNWNYLGGLVDGEGCIGLYLNESPCRKNGVIYSFTPHIQISNYTKLPFYFDSLKKWLEKQDVLSYVNKNKNRLDIASWRSVRIFCEYICPYLIIKQEEITLMIKALNIRSSAPRRGLVIDYTTIRPELLLIAQQLQSLKSNKGKSKKYVWIKDQPSNIGHYNK